MSVRTLCHGRTTWTTSKERPSFRSWLSQRVPLHCSPWQRVLEIESQNPSKNIRNCRGKRWSANVRILRGQNQHGSEWKSSNPLWKGNDTHLCTWFNCIEKAMVIVLFARLFCDTGYWYVDRCNPKTDSQACASHVVMSWVAISLVIESGYFVEIRSDIILLFYNIQISYVMHDYYIGVWYICEARQFHCLYKWKNSCRSQLNTHYFWKLFSALRRWRCRPSYRTQDGPIKSFISCEAGEWFNVSHVQRRRDGDINNVWKGREKGPRRNQDCCNARQVQCIIIQNEDNF